AGAEEQQQRVSQVVSLQRRGQAILLRDLHFTAGRRRRRRDGRRKGGRGARRRQLDRCFLRDRVVAEPAFGAALVSDFQLQRLRLVARGARDRQRRFEHFVVHLGVA